jgi:hypothetical protein
MRAICCFLTLLILAGCFGPTYQPGDRRLRDPASLSLLDQYKFAQGSFQKKLTDARGLTLTELKARWGRVRQGITQNDSTVYHWVRTISVSPPPETAAKLGLGDPSDGQASGQTLALSCMAIFIVNQSWVVDEAFSEGRCLDHSLMPGWRPVIEKGPPLAGF